MKYGYEVYAKEECFGSEELLKRRLGTMYTTKRICGWKVVASRSKKIPQIGLCSLMIASAGSCWYLY